MELAAYLERIGYSGPVVPPSSVLRDLHRQHLFTIPFENLDIPLKREIRLDLPQIYDKLVTQRRGGFCYEQNGLFYWALRGFGFDVQMLSARVARPNGGYGPEFDHMLLLVTIDGERWLADVGFGDSFREPLQLDGDAPQADGGVEYRVIREGDEYVLWRWEEGDWQRKFVFTLQPRQLSDFAPMCVYQQTSPESSFTKRRVCSLATPNGRITLTEKALIVTENGVKIETPLESQEEFEQLLQKGFGIGLTGFPALATK